MPKQNKAAAKGGKSDTLESVRAAAMPKSATLAAPVVAIATFASLDALDLPAIVAKLKTAGALALSGSAEKETAKLLVALDNKRGDGGTLAKFARSQGISAISSTAYKAAAAFAAMVGEGVSFIIESDFDASPVRWLVVVSSILGLLVTKADDVLTAGTREAVAGILRERPKDGQKRLNAIRDTLKGTSDGAKGDGNDESDDESKTASADLLSVETVKALRDAITACDNADTCEQFAGLFAGLSQIAAERAESLRAPVAQAA
jgi:hypothetical protein